MGVVRRGAQPGLLSSPPRRRGTCEDGLGIEIDYHGLARLEIDYHGLARLGARGWCPPGPWLIVVTNASTRSGVIDTMQLRRVA